MKRAPIVISATVAGLAGVLAFHTTPAALSPGALPAADGGQPAAPAGRAAPSGHPSSYPHSGRPAVRVGSASVTGPDLGLADALATAVAVAGEPGLAFIGPLDGYEALIIGLDGGRSRTEHFPFSAPQ